jgi:hypothetical protein
MLKSYIRKRCICCRMTNLAQRGSKRMNLGFPIGCEGVQMLNVGLLTLSMIMLKLKLLLEKILLLHRNENVDLALEFVQFSIAKENLQHLLLALKFSFDAIQTRFIESSFIAINLSIEMFETLGDFNPMEKSPSQELLCLVELISPSNVLSMVSLDLRRRAANSIEPRSPRETITRCTKFVRMCCRWSSWH